MDSQQKRFRFPIGAFLAAVVLSAPLFLQAQTPLPEALSLTAADNEILIADAAGRHSRFEKAPRIILALGADAAAIADLLYAFPQGRERLAGIEREPGSLNLFLARLDPDFAKKAILPPDASLETIASLKPEVVLWKGRQLFAKAPALAAAGIPVVHLGMDSPEQYERDLSVVGALLGAKERADELLTFFRGRYGRILMTLSGISTADKPRVLLLRVSSAKGAMTLELPPSPSMPISLIRAAGGIIIGEETADKSARWNAVGSAQIADWNPDVVVLSPPEGADPAAVVASFKSDRRLANLRAVKSGRIFVRPRDFEAWDSADPRWILGLNWLAARFLPRLFPDYDMRTDSEPFFQRLYGLGPEITASIILPVLR
jgi:iron complex transport system substrate-binding protein